jgi:hypothetical protein
MREFFIAEIVLTPPPPKGSAGTASTVTCHPALAAERLALIEPLSVFMTTMVYEPFVPSSPPESIDPSAAEHATISVMTAAATDAMVAALRYFALRIKSFLCLFTGLFD